MKTTLGLTLPFALSVIAPLTLVADGTVRTNPPSMCTAPTGGCGCGEASGDADSVTNACIKVSVGLGETTPWTGSLPCALKIFADDNAPSIFTEESLHATLGGYTFKRLGQKTLADGETPAEVVFSHPYGEEVRFVFPEGESWGRPDPTVHIEMDERLMMVDAEGWAATSDPVYYDLYVGDGTRRRFLATNMTGALGSLVSVTDAHGATITPEEMGVDLVYGMSGVRQFLTPSRLANVALAPERDGYDVFVYAVDAPPQKDAATGLYATPDATPLKHLSIRSRNGGKRAVVTFARNGGAAKTYVFDYVMGEWSLARESGVKEEKERQMQDKVRAQIVKAVKSKDGELLARTEMNFKWMSWGFAPTNRVEGFGGVTDTTTWTYYTSGNGKGQVKKEVRQSGLTTEYAYDASDRIISETRSGPDMMTETTVYDYTPVDASDPVLSVDTRPRTVVRKLNDIECERTYYVYSPLTNIVERVGTQGAAYGGTNVLRTVTAFYPVVANDARSGFVQSIRHEDGKLDLYDYELASNTWIRTVTHLHEQSPSPVSGKTTRDITTTNARGEIFEEKTEAYIDGIWYTIARNRMTYNAEGKRTSLENLAGQVTTTAWDCCHKVSETQPDGSTTTWDYDDEGRMIASSRLIPLDMTNVTWLTTCYEYDDLGRQTATWQTNYAAQVGTFVDRWSYDALDREVAKIGKNGVVRKTVYSDNGLTATTIFEDGATRIIKNSADDGILHVAGTASVGEHHLMSVLENGCRKVTVAMGPADGRMCGHVLKNMLGQKTQVVRPGIGDTRIITDFDYDRYGRITRQARHFETNCINEVLEVEIYNEDVMSGRRTICKDRNLNGIVDFDGEDLIAEEGSLFILTNGVVASEMAKYAWPQAGSDRCILDAFAIEYYDTTNMCAVAGVLDPCRNMTFAMTKFSADDGLGYVRTFCPSSSVPSVVCKKYGVVVYESSFACVTNFYVYDFLGRSIVRIDGKGIEKERRAYDEWGRVSTLHDEHGRRMEFAYDERGRVARRTSQATEVFFVYDFCGNIIQRAIGDCRQEFEYDEYGRQTLMRTFRNLDEAGDDTRWDYDAGTGLLVRMSHADGRGVNYEYSPDGRLLSRRWARGVNTVYSYDSALRLDNVSYSDGTPSVSFQYDRRDNLMAHVVDGGCACFYAVAETGAVTNESQNGVSISRSYDSLGRLNHLAVSNDFEVVYGYDEFGRIASVGDGDIAMSLARSDRSDRICRRETGRFSQDIIYNATNMHVSAITNYVDSVIQSAVLYTYDQDVRKDSAQWIRRRDGVLSENYFSFGYDLRSFLSVTERSSLAGSQFTERFQSHYDGNGNLILLESVSDGMWDASAVFFHNNLNQITECVQSNANGIVDSAVFAYDPDGNMISDGRMTYSWDGENRLTSVSCDGDGFSTTYSYDGLGRMIRESYTNSITGNAWNRTMLWDEYNLLCSATTHDESETRQYFAYGPDVEGRLHGTAGIGGLAYMRVGDAVYIPICDEFGNVMSCISRNGEAVAEFMYDGFAPINMGLTNDLGVVIPTFNSMRHDDRAELLHYTFRSFSFKWNVWLNRDPCGEIGFSLIPGHPSEMPSKENLYGFKGNSPVSSYDRFGLDNPGCDVVGVFPWFDNKCPLECCAKHDECFDRNDCTVWSWIHTLIPFTCDTPCDGCNKNVARCLRECIPHPDDPIDPDPEGRYYYCAKLNKRVKDKSECPK